MRTTENRICGYSSLLIAILLNSPRLLALRINGMIGQYWQFNVAEWTFQVTFNLAFCLLVFHLNLNQRQYLAHVRTQKRYAISILYSIVVLFVSIFIGTRMQRICFGL